MGKEIVYCGECGASLRESDFSKGKANYHGFQPYCVMCRPVQAGSEAPKRGTERIPKVTLATKPATSRASVKTRSETPRRGTSRIPKVTLASKPSTARAVAQTNTRRARAGGSGSNSMMIVAGAAVGFVLLIVVVAVATSTSSPPSRAPVKSPTPAVTTAPRTPPRRVVVPEAPVRGPQRVETDRRDPAVILSDLEGFVSGKQDPTDILLRIDQVKSALKGTPQEKRLLEIEQDALARKQKSEETRQLDLSLREVDRIRAADKEFKSREEVLSLLAAALEVAGSRKPEVERLIDAYKKEADAFAKAQAVQPTPAPTPAPAPKKPAPAPTFDVGIEGVSLVTISDAKPVSGFDPIPEGATINLAKLPSRDVSIRFDPPRGRKIGSMRVHISPGGNQHVESEAPYFIAGNTGDTIKPWPMKVGAYVLSIRTFSKADAKGTAGPVLRRTFTVIDDPNAP